MPNNTTDLAIDIITRLECIAKNPKFDITPKTVIEISNFVFEADRCSLLNKEIFALFTQCLESDLSHIRQYREPAHSEEICNVSGLHAKPFSSPRKHYFMLIVYKLTSTEDSLDIPTVFGVQFLDIDSIKKWEICPYLKGIVNTDNKIKFKFSNGKSLKGYERYHHVFSTRLLNKKKNKPKK